MKLHELCTLAQVYPARGLPGATPRPHGGGTEASEDFQVSAINEGVSLAMVVYDENDICENVYVEFRPQRGVIVSVL